MSYNLVNPFWRAEAKTADSGVFNMGDGGDLLAGTSFEVLLPTTPFPKVSFLAWNGHVAGDSFLVAGDVHEGYGVTNGVDRWAIEIADQYNTDPVNNASVIRNTCCITTTTPGAVNAGIADITFGIGKLIVTIISTFSENLTITYLVLGGTAIDHVAVGTGVCPGATGNQDIPLAGWGAAIPDFVMLGSVSRNAFSPGATARLGLGWECSAVADGRATSRYSGAHAQSDGIGTTLINNYWYNAQTLTEVTANGLTQLNAAVTRQAANIRLTWGNVTSGRLFGYAAIHGMTFKNFEFDSRTNTTPFNTPSLGFTPIAMIARSMNRTFSHLPALQTTGTTSFGFATGPANRRSLATFRASSQATTVGYGRMLHQSSILSGLNSNAAVRYVMDLNSFNADSATLQYDDPDASTGSRTLVTAIG